MLNWEASQISCSLLGYVTMYTKYAEQSPLTESPVCYSVFSVWNLKTSKCWLKLESVWPLLQFFSMSTWHGSSTTGRRGGYPTSRASFHLGPCRQCGAKGAIWMTSLKSMEKRWRTRKCTGSSSSGLPSSSSRTLSCSRTSWSRTLTTLSTETLPMSWALSRRLEQGPMRSGASKCQVPVEMNGKTFEQHFRPFSHQV